MSQSFAPISSKSDFLKIDEKYKLSCEERLRNRHHQLYNRLLSDQSAIINRISRKLSELRGFYRFLSNDKVCMSDLINKHCQIAKTLLEGRHILALGDGVSINLASSYGRMSEEEKLKTGVLENNLTRGLMAQVMLAIDAQNEEVLGLSDILLYNRSKRHEVVRHAARKLEFEQKESYKWVLSANNAKAHLEGCSQLTYIFDREADRFEILNALRQIKDTEFIIRSRENRLVTYQNQNVRINQILEQENVKASYELNIRGQNHLIRQGRARKYRQARKSKIELKWFRIDQINVPNEFKKKYDPIKDTYYFIQAKESAKDIPEGEKAIDWKIITTHSIKDEQEAQRIVQYYQYRWHIEQLFRVSKKQGLELENNQLGSINAIMRLTIMTMSAACKIMQLNLARENVDSDINFVFEKEDQEVLLKLNEQLEGKTKKQKNPYEKDKLSWAKWIIGRLGGWKGYYSQGPPGPISISRGFKEFTTFKRAWELFIN